MWLDLGLLSFVFAMGLGTVTYASYARMKGWTVGKIYTAEWAIVGLMSAITSLVVSFIVWKFWTPILVIVIGYTLMVIFISLLKKNSQWFLLPLASIGAVYCSSRIFDFVW